MYSLAPIYPDLLSKAAVVDGPHSPVSGWRQMRCWRQGAVLGIEVFSTVAGDQEVAADSSTRAYSAG